MGELSFVSAECYLYSTLKRRGCIAGVKLTLWGESAL